MITGAFTGKDRILGRFRQMPPAAQEAAGTTLRVQVDELAAALRRAAPISSLGKHPGELRDTIEVFANETRVLSFRIMSTARDDKGWYWGRSVEFGHIAADGTFVPAQPFFFATYRAWKRGMQAAIRTAVRARLKADFSEFAP